MLESSWIQGFPGRAVMRQVNVAVSLRFWTSQAIGALNANGWNWQHTIQHGGSSAKLKIRTWFLCLESLSCWVGGWVTSNVSKLWALFWQACDLRHCRRANAWICERGATTAVWKNSLELQLKFCQHGRPVSFWRNARCHSDARHTGGDMCREVLQKMD